MIAWFIRNRVAANLLLLSIAAAGLLTIRNVPREILPETEPSAVTVRAVLPGAGADEVEDGLLVPLEDAVDGVSGVGEVQGLATDGVARLTARVETWADFDAVRNEIRERIESLEGLPADAEDPVIAELKPMRRLMRIGVHGEAGEHALMEAAHLVRERLLPVPGVAGVELETGRDYEIAIEITEDRLLRFGLAFDQVASAIRRQSVDVPGGTLRTDARELRLGVEGRALAARDFARIPLISTPDGGLVTVGDVATVTDGFADVERDARMNGEPAVVLRVLQASGAKLLATVDAVEERLSGIREALPDAISVTPWENGWRLFVVRRDLLVSNGLQGLALIFLVLFFTLSSRLAFWTTAGLPVAFFGAFALMPGLGVTLNMMSLFAFILTLGIVVDDAIVVGENVQRHLSGRTEGLDGAAVRGVRQVLFPAAFGVLTTMAAFAPLLGLPGFWGEIMGPIPRIAISVLAFSLIEAAWILPHHLAHGGLPVRPNPTLARTRAGFASLLEWTADRLYRPMLAWSLRNRLTTLALGLSSLILVGGLIGGGWVQVEDAPPFDSSVITLEVTLPPGSPYEATAEVVARVEDAVHTVREEIRSAHGMDPQRHLVSLTGQNLATGAGAELGGGDAGAGAAIGQLTLEMPSTHDLRGFSSGEVADRLRELTRSLPHGGEVEVNASLLGQEANVSIRISGSDLTRLREASAGLQRQIAEYAGVVTVQDDLAGDAPRLVGRIRADGAGTGLRAAEVGRQLRQGFHGEEVQRIRRRGDEVRVVLRFARADREDPDRVGRMRIRSPGAAAVPIGEVVDLTRESGLSVVRRVNGRRAVTVDANVDSRVASPAAVLRDLETGRLPDLRGQYPEFRFEVTGTAEDMRETTEALFRHFVLALLLVYVLLAVPLSSWTQPFVILAAVPFGLFGAFVGHLVMGLSLSINSLFGMVPLVGIVVNDALVLLNFINRSRRDGASVPEALLAAGPRRFRPIVLTTLTTCAGLAPLLFERSVDAQFLVPVAASLAFGVAFATVVILVLVPVLYSLADEGLSSLRFRPRLPTVRNESPTP